MEEGNFYQGSQYRIGNCTDLATSTIYFGYWPILVYRFGFTVILYILYIFIYIHKKRGKMVNDIISTGRIIFSSLVPHLFFSTVARLKVFFF